MSQTHAKRSLNEPNQRAAHMPAGWARHAGDGGWRCGRGYFLLASAARAHGFCMPCRPRPTVRRFCSRRGPSQPRRPPSAQANVGRVRGGRKGRKGRGRGVGYWCRWAPLRLRSAGDASFCHVRSGARTLWPVASGGRAVACSRGPRRASARWTELTTPPVHHLPRESRVLPAFLPPCATAGFGPRPLGADE